MLTEWVAPVLIYEYGMGGACDFVAGLGYTDTQEAKREILGHLPVWAEFRVDEGARRPYPPVSPLGPPAPLVAKGVLEKNP